MNVVEPEVPTDPTSPSVITTQNNEEKINFNPTLQDFTQAHRRQIALVSYRDKNIRARSSSLLGSSRPDLKSHAFNSDERLMSS